jgi:Tol biopolymer transport system component
LRSTFLSVIVFLGGLPLAAAPPSLDAAQNSLSALHDFREVAVSPGGDKVAWIESAPGKIESDRPSLSVYVKDLRDAGAGTRRIGDPGSMAQGLAWSEDGKLAFLSDFDSHGQLQLYVAEKPGRGKPRKIGEFTGYIELPQWSPDGKSIAVLLIEGSSRVPGPTEATPAETGVIASTVMEKRLAIVNLGTGAARAISPADMYVYEFDWSPDSKELAYLAAPGDGDDNWYVAEIFAINAETGAVRHIFKPTMQAANVRWSPDGKTIAFISGLMSDEGVIGGEIYALPAEGGTPRDLTPDRKASPNWFRWSPSS